MIKKHTICFYVVSWVVGLNVSLSATCHAGYGIATISAVNLEDGPYQNSSSIPFSSVSTQASGSSGSTSAFASFDGELDSASMAANGILNHGPGSVATFLSTFQVVGNTNNIILPLNFNFVFEGNLSASTSPPLAGYVAVSQISFNAQDSYETVSGNASMTSQAGITTGQTGGILGDSDLNNLVSVGFSLFSPVAVIDSLLVNLSTETVASTTGVAIADASIFLTSISVPYGYTAVDPSTLSIEFDSGVTMSVGYASVPEPPAVGMLILGLLIVASKALARIKFRTVVFAGLCKRLATEA